MRQDSTGNPIYVGDKVRFRGRVYTILGFGTFDKSVDVYPIYFKENQHTPEVANETSVDKITGGET